MNDLSPEIQFLLREIGRAGREIGQPVWVVGGFVRDYYLKRTRSGKPDIDCATVGSGILVAEKFASFFGNTAFLTTFKNFGTAKVELPTVSIEFVGARKESYDRTSRKPAVENGTLEDDQIRRDFSINALYWSLNEGDFGTLIDPFFGIRDLNNGIIRTPTDPNITFTDDPLRMMRAVRFASELKFKIELSTFEGIKANKECISIISKERVIDELSKIIRTEKPSFGFELLFVSGLLKIIFPDMMALHGVSEYQGQRHKDNFWHTLQVLDNVAAVSDNEFLRWAAVFHDIAKPPTQRFEPGIGWTFHGHDALGAKMAKRIFRDLGLPLDERLRYVQKLVRLHLRPIALVKDEVSDSAIRRLLFDAGEEIDDLMTLCRADITSKNDDKVRRYLKNFDEVELKMKEVEAKDQLRAWKPPVDGNEIMERYQLAPGREVGILKEALKEAILNGEIPNEYEIGLQFLDEMVKKGFQ